ncbi:MAG: hypothetical protein D4R93_05285 [Deltaproteobacteria bacterium]|nr:MAG: hypothetical protein D4R93_05285 [Deltaproteobacteria bacterium]
MGAREITWVIEKKQESDMGIKQIIMTCTGIPQPLETPYKVNTMPHRNASFVSKHIRPFLCIFVLLTFPLLSFSTVEADIADSLIGFKVKPDRPLMQDIPEISLNEADLALLSSGKPVTRLLDTPGGLKASYMRIFLPFDPPTIWHIITDIHHFSIVSPQYPKNGSLTNKRQTFMPYVFDSSACENGRYLYQLLVMPMIAPRHFTLKRSTNRIAFPWESKWSQEPEMRCQDKLNPEMEKYRTEAIITAKNEGSWRLSPLSKEFIKRKEDLLKTDCIYYVDSNPGGNLSSLMGIVNKVTEIVLPALAENLIFHAKQWDDHMRKHHTSRQYEEWKAQVTAYLSERGYAP